MIGNPTGLVFRIMKSPGTGRVKEAGETEEQKTLVCFAYLYLPLLREDRLYLNRSLLATVPAGP